ncbi:Baculoviral IAP repeat-containing 7 [Gossypium arboreum]|uniref:RING-type domain-containing protein n=6 Tax=Gossypium TaxID=3633 RepID=A0A2P5YGG0_GOSBA|nr:probable BOI-related E3 ubiquitin-protein ligase 3 [Gossypium hirsutum]XP_017622319.1 probable BOI-related E3 ubiquitin-protein ligase 3 [Gossypium arboreum]KAB2097561.1 hypothetical protein ES319_A01G178500v1 [Gossypium barbadense]TYH31727.1 hypothetical protein ES288_A01G194900v1 [Gossypium darwinii]TYI43912.1 hypothetical protein ES332_A01G200400v1 [Gossypium tomentosum]KAG4215297.1 hypothetical protein ERO13_A01G168800v2 [Gossypium hirsutum]KAK5842193.1 hypothetical protein PVK06_00452
MAIQAQLYSDNIGFPICGSLDLIDNGCGLVGAAAGFNQQISSQLQQLQQFQHLQNQHQRDQTFSFGSTNNNRESIMFEKQRYEIDQFIKSQNERLRLLLQEQRKQQYEVLVKKIESKASFLLRQKDEEIVKARNKTMELQNMLKKLEMENQAWQRVAQENEAMVVSLNNRLEQVREEQASCRFNNGVDDAESCCECEDNNEGIMETKGNGSFAAVDSSNQRQEEQEEKTTMVCKCCYCRNSSVLFLPCRHLCSCKDCATFLDSCPVCRTPKKACIEALIS